MVFILFYYLFEVRISSSVFESFLKNIGESLRVSIIHEIKGVFLKFIKEIKKKLYIYTHK